MPLYIYGRAYMPPPSGYSGPGDVVSGTAAWYGTRGYNAAYSTGANPAFDLLDQTGANPLTVNVLSTGALDVASINTWVAANSVTTIKITKAYDQSGNARHLTQGTLGAMPALTLNAIGSLPAILFSGGQTLSGTYTPGLSQPISCSCVVKATAATDAGLFNINNTAASFNYHGTTSKFDIYPGGVDWVTAASYAFNNWYAAQLIANGASTTSYINGATAAMSGGSGTNGTGTALQLGTDGFGDNYTGYIGEIGIWGSDFTLLSRQSNMDANQRAYWGF